MSRIGKKPIKVPSGVELKVDGSNVAVKGPKGSLQRDLHPNMKIEFQGETISVDGADVTLTVRTEQSGAQASLAAAMPEVRACVLDVQRKFRRPPGLVADGRDMGTVVFVDAGLKIFLDASAEERAQRRYKQLKNKGLSVSLPDLLVQLEERDARDRGRSVAPLKPAEDALLIDSTSMTIEAVFDQVMVWLSERGIHNLP